MHARFASSVWTRTFLAATTLLGSLGMLWALASPLMAVPDEPAHAIRAAAVVRGQIDTPLSDEIPYANDVRVPRWVAHTSALPCFRFDPTISASCQPAINGDPDATVDAVTTAGANSPLYYFIVGLPSLFTEGSLGLYAMRAVNVLIVSVLFGCAFASMRRLGADRWGVAALAVGITPMVVFLTGSINPNSVEFASAAALFATLLAVVRTDGSRGRLVADLGVIVVSATLLVNTRNISLLWAALIVGLALLASSAPIFQRVFRAPWTWVAVGASLVAAITAALWFLRPVEVVADEDVPVYPAMGGSFFYGLQIMLDRTFEFATGWIGLFGWIDSPAPGIAVLIWSALITAVITAAIAVGRGRLRFVLIASVIVALGLPIIIQSILLVDYGIIWQGRYMLAMYLCVMVAAGACLASAQLPVTRAVISAWRIALVAAAIGHLATFIWVLRRYVIGSGAWAEMLRAPEWQPPLTWTVLSVLYALVLVAACALLLPGPIAARRTGLRTGADSGSTAKA